MLFVDDGSEELGGDANVLAGNTEIYLFDLKAPQDDSGSGSN